MEQYKSLRQICDNLRISRRAIQGYEKAGLIVPSSRNKYGHLLYDKQAVMKIAVIKFLQKIGLSVRDIKPLMEMDPLILLEAFKEQLALLQNQQTELNELSSKTNQIISKLAKNEENDYLKLIYEIIKEE